MHVDCSGDHGEVPGGPVEPVGSGRVGDHDVLEPHPEPTGEIDARLDAERVPGRERCGIAGDEVRVLVRVEPDAVTDPVDEGVGEIFKVLERTKQLDNTLVIFSSDNGFFWGEHGLADKRWPYEESIRDPFLMRLPRLIKPGSTFDQLVLNIDLAPTLLELAGAPIPKSIQGRSLLPLLGDPKTAWRSSFFCEYFQEKPYPQTPTWQAVRSQDWKYIHYPDLKDMDELYEIRADPAELKNRIKDERAQTKLADLKTELEKMLKSPN
jgi:N-acetylglucosamine-6-sulfatase